jgi:hypothetical protein
MENAQTSVSEGIVAVLMFGVFFLPWVTWGLSEILLVLYRRTVVRSMRAVTTAVPAAAGVAAPAAAVEPRVVDLQVQTADDTPLTTSSGGHALHREVRRATSDAMKIYAAGGVVYALVMALAAGFRLQTRPAGVVFFGIAFAWPLVLTALYIVAPARRWQAGLIVAYWILFFTSGSATMSIEDQTPFLMANLGATVAALVARARRIRAVAPLVGAFLMLLGVTVIVAGTLIGVIDTPANRTGEIGGVQAILILLILPLGLVGGPIAGWLALRVLGRLYAQKNTSDQAITMAAIWLIFAGVHAATFAYDDVRWMVFGLVAFAAFVLATRMGFRVLRRRSEKPRGRRLLVLRVFALGRRSRRLFDRLAAEWRHLGSVQLIAGPDLASSTVEPHEFFDFLRRRLGGRFLESRQSIDTALAELDTEPDHDGRYRITDFFCRDSAWRTVFAELAAGADVVLMDLRGFSSENCGCAYEVAALLNLVPLDRIAIVIDRGTDERFLAQTIEQASTRMSPESPNRHDATIQVRAFRATGWRGLDPDRLLRLLCDTVTRPHRARAAPAI